MELSYIFLHGYTLICYFLFLAILYNNNHDFNTHLHGISDYVLFKMNENNLNNLNKSLLFFDVIPLSKVGMFFTAR